jgi:cobalt-precorrin 5A hydrolase
MRPACLVAGVGCNRGTSREELARLLAGVLADHGLARSSLARLASARAKADELGLRRLAQDWKLELSFFDHQQLAAVEVPHPSQIVQRHLGTPSVCEAAAVLASGGGELLVAKHKSENATVAVALEESTC